MASTFLVALLVMSVVLEFSGVCQGQYECLFNPGKCPRSLKLEDAKPSLPESDLLPLNEFRRNKLMRLTEMLQNKRSRFDDDADEEK